MAPIACGRLPDRVLAFSAEMSDLARTFVSFSSADKGRYDLMCAWKAHEHIDFNFADFQLDEAVKSQDPYSSRRFAGRKFVASTHSFS